MLNTLSSYLENERDNGVSLLLRPLLLGLGILIYFKLTDEPNPYLLWLITFILLLLKRFTPFKIMFWVVFLMSLGLSLSSLRSHLVTHAVLEAPTRIITLKGWVEKIERRDTNDRVTLILSDHALERVRVVSRQRIGQRVGEAVEVKATLIPPSTPSRPDGYDFARDSWFNGLAAVGYSLGDFKSTTLENRPWGVGVTEFIETIREKISARIRLQLAGETGAFADALITGRRDGISKNTQDALRAAGTYHILSISGFHMSLVAAFIFTLVRGFFALIPAIAMRFNVKVAAAVITFFATSFYLALAGAEVATLRSWLMVALIMLGIITNRLAFTLNTLCAAATIILVLYPETLLSPSFQMSFSATLVLVAGYKGVQAQANRLSLDKPFLTRTLIFLSSGVIGLAIASLFAGLATMPFTAYHFHQIQLYGLFGNVIGAPIIEFFVMPLEIIALILWGFGLDGWLWGIIGSATDLFLNSAHWIATWKGNTLNVPIFSPVSLMAFGYGFALLLMLSTHLRWLGAALMVIATLTAFNVEKPLLLVDGDAKTVALFEGEKMQIITPKPTIFIVNEWVQAYGVSNEKFATPVCDVVGCSFSGVVTMLKSHEEIAYDCEKSKVLLVKIPVTIACNAYVVELNKAQPFGGFALYKDGRIVHARSKGGRLWAKQKPFSQEEIDRVYE